MKYIQYIQELETTFKKAHRKYTKIAVESINNNFNLMFVALCPFLIYLFAHQLKSYSTSTMYWAVLEAKDTAANKISNPPS